MALKLFEGFGVELEYMIVDSQTLSVRPIADELLARASGAAHGEHPSDFDVPGMGITWSNELTLHVLEFKTTDPVPTLSGLPARFDDSVQRAMHHLAPLGAKLMPGAMHPWMDPFQEMRLWPHDSAEFYAAFDRIFDCRGHGWANLQSVHLNLPFAGDEEFASLHAAIRLILPILPALAASSPIMDGRPTGMMDSRLAVYRSNARRVPSVSGRVIPEPVFTQAAYEQTILQTIYSDLAPHDPEGILRHEWANARGAIARFTRGSIEIRVLDMQECPAADVAICAAITAVLRDLVSQRWGSLSMQQQWPIDPLEQILLDTINHADQAVIHNPDYLAAFGLRARSCTAAELWSHLFQTSIAPSTAPEHLPPLRTILDHGPLARRILRATTHHPLADIFRELCDCLPNSRMFQA